MSTERWLTEGLAQVYAAELIRLDGDGPRTPVEPVAADPAALPLTEWGGVGSERAVEEYGYATSFWVVDALVDELGFERTDEVVAALQSGRSPYDGTVPGHRPTQDWQRVYDMFVEVAGSEAAHDVFRSWVVNPSDIDLVEQRDVAATDVIELAERSAPWALPIGVRNVLERWELDAVDAAIADADDVLVRRSELESIEAKVGIDEPDRADEAYAAASRRRVAASTSPIHWRSSTRPSQSASGSSLATASSTTWPTRHRRHRRHWARSTGSPTSPPGSPSPTARSRARTDHRS